VGIVRLLLVRDLSLVKDTVMIQQVGSQKEMQGLCQKCMSVVEDIVILLPGEAGGKCKARIGEGLVSCQRYCDDKTGWTPEGNARLVSKIYMSLEEDVVILLPGKPVGCLRLVLLRDLSLVKDTVMIQQVGSQKETQGLCQRDKSLLSKIL